ncbi:MAG: hypothetical protein ACRES4_04230 [Nevskiales bacterium]
MNKSAILILSLLLSTASLAATAPPDAQTQKIVDEVRDLAAKARKERSADPWLLKALDDLVQRHYWPWRHSVVDESFADGDYSKNPVWEIASGKFWVDRSLGLRSKAAPPPAAAADTSQDKKKFKDALKEAVLAEMAGQKQQPAQQATPSATAAEIYLPAKITNSFALDVSFTQHQPPAETGQIEFGLFEGARGGRGYVLVVTTGKEDAVELLRIKGTSAAIVERKILPEPIDTGDLQKISWRRDPQGGMVVLLNDKLLIETGDRGLTTPFTGLGIINRAGDFAVKQVKLVDAG